MVFVKDQACRKTLPPSEKYFLSSRKEVLDATRASPYLPRSKASRLGPVIPERRSEKHVTQLPSSAEKNLLSKVDRGPSSRCRPSQQQYSMIKVDAARHDPKKENFFLSTLGPSSSSASTIVTVRNPLQSSLQAGIKKGVFRRILTSSSTNLRYASSKRQRPPESINTRRSFPEGTTISFFLC